MTLNRLRTFVVVASCLNLRRAAEKLHISQPSVSQQLKLLEEEFGKKFHTKVGRGIELTEEGRLFLKDAEAIVLHVEKVKEKFGNRSLETEIESLTVGGTYAASANLLPSVLTEFKRRHPNVQVSLLTDSREAIEKKVVGQEIDIAMVSDLNPPSHVIAEAYSTMKLVAFAAKDHPIAKKKELSLTELAKTPIIVRGAREAASITGAILKQLSDLGFKPNIAMRCQSPEGVKMAVRKRLGVGILYNDLVRSELRSGEFKAIKLPELNLDAKLFVIYPRKKTLLPYTRDFLTLLHQRRRRDYN